MMKIRFENFKTVSKFAAGQKTRKGLQMESFSEFVIRNEGADTAMLLLSREKYRGLDMDLAVNTIEVRRKLRKKVPSWYDVPELAYPLKLSGEQCSSEATAIYKAGLVRRLFPDGKARVADLTGGLGVDAWAFSQVSEAVLYNEMNPDLAKAAERNFRLLGRDNITVTSYCVTAAAPCHSDRRAKPEACETVAASASCHFDRRAQPEVEKSAHIKEILQDFHPDLLFLDPARRDTAGRKVFLLEDCSPDILSLKKELFDRCRFILLKLSPMADITMLLDRLGPECREIHILASGGECKEVLVLMDREFSGDCSFTVCSGASSMTFTCNELAEAVPRFLSSHETLRPDAVLYEPGKALMKAGAFNILCEKFPLEKLARFTHYYIFTPENPHTALESSASEPERRPDPDSPTASFPAELSDNGKFFLIKEVLPLNNRNLKDIALRYPKGEVTARNIKMDTDTLRRKLRIASGATLHIFALSCALPAPSTSACQHKSTAENLLLVTEPLG